jgi:hemoglobin-like flavoprotein
MARSLETPLFTKTLSPGLAARRGGGPDARSIELVQASWAQVLPIADAAATLFYDRLFELDPSLRALFKRDLGEQKKKLMLTLGVAVDGLRNPAKLAPVLHALGVRHAGYMVAERHYALVGEALLWTLREGLGDAFTPDLSAAWAEVYGYVSSEMKQAAAEAKRASPPRGIVVPSASAPRIDMDLPAVEALPLGGRTLPGGVEIAAPIDVAAPGPHGTNGAGPPLPAAPAPAAMALPHEMTLHVLIKVDTPPLVQMSPPPVHVPAPRPPPPEAPPVLGLGTLAVALCAASAAGTALLLAAADRAAAGLALYGAPLTITILVLGAFAAGRFAGQSKPPASWP